jgi:phage virion morphogenesis protein
MTQIEIQITVADLDSALDEIEARLGDLTPFMREVKGIMLDAVEQNFEEQGRPEWAGLTPSTIRQREREGKWPGKILQRSGRLASSIVGESGKDFATVGTNLEYAAIHQFGGEVQQFAQTRFVNFKVDSRGRSRFAPRGEANFAQAVTYGPRTFTIPARPFLALTADDENEILFALGEYLTQGLS